MTRKKSKKLFFFTLMLCVVAPFFLYLSLQSKNSLQQIDTHTNKRRQYRVLYTQIFHLFYKHESKHKQVLRATLTVSFILNEV